MYKKLLPILALVILAIFNFVYQQIELPQDNRQNIGINQKIDAPIKQNSKNLVVIKNGFYISKNEVSSYIFKYNSLPKNYITKKEAMKLGWQSKSYNLWDVAPNKSIGGDRFKNYENRLPNKNGRIWKECDIDYKGGKRNAKRLVFSNDGLIYYTNDHYNSFEKIDKDIK